jgi:hypothetical protein
MRRAKAMLIQATATPNSWRRFFVSYVPTPKSHNSTISVIGKPSSHKMMYTMIILLKWL